MRKQQLITKYEKQREQLQKTYAFADDLKAHHITRVLKAMIDTNFVLLIDLKSE